MKTISKILSIVLCLAMVMALFVVGASADEIAKVTSIAVGDTIIFMNIDGSKAMGSQHNSNYRNSVDAADAVKFTVEAGSAEGSFAFKDPSGNYLSWSGSDSSNNKLYNVSSITAASSWNVAFDGSGNATITNVGKPARELQYNASSPRFAAYTGSQQKVTIYKVGGEACTHEGTGRVVVRDADKHWNSCQECGAIVGEKVAHSFTNGVCSCGFANHVATPVAGTTYKAGTYQGSLDKFVYLTGAESGNYLATTSNVAEAADVFVETVTGGYRFYVMVQGVKNYIDVVPSPKSDNTGYYYNAKLVTEPTCTWTWNEEYDTFVTVMTTGYDEPTEHYVGTYNNYETISSSKLSYAATSFPLHLYATATNDDTGNDGGDTGNEGGDTGNDGGSTNTPEPPKPFVPSTGVDTPVSGTAFKLGLYQKNVGKYLYFNNTTPSADRPYYQGTTDKFSEAVDVFAEAVEGGYKLYFMDGTTKTYIDIYQNGNYVNLRLTTEPTAVFTWNTEHKTFITKIGETEYYIGTYDNYETLSASKLSYIADSFATHLYAKEPAKTGDNSVISVAVAAAVLSVMGAAVLVSKKKEF